MQINKPIFLLLTFIALIQPVMAGASSQVRFYSEEEGVYFYMPPNPAKKIDSQDVYKDLSQGKSITLKFKAPSNWQVRAVYIERSKDIIEFDRGGHVIYDGIDPVDISSRKREIFSMEQILLNDKPFWIGAEIFRKVSDANREDRSPLFATTPSGLVRARNGRFCPVREVKSRKNFGIDRYTLDGDCDAAIRVTINGGQYWTYPVFKRIKEPYFYWKIQYFNDPIEPFPSAGEGCLLYCDEASRRAAEDRSKAK